MESHEKKVKSKKNFPPKQSQGKEMYRVSRSAVLLDGECSEAYDVQQGEAQGCSLSPILFSVFINGLLKEVEQAGLGVELSDGSTIGGMLFADDFVGVSNSEEELQRLINVAHAYCCKSAVVKVYLLRC